MIPPIESRRLSLRSMGVTVMEALLVGDRIGAGRMLECKIPDDLPLQDLPLAMRLGQVRRDPTELRWLLRASVERASETMIGHFNFHTPPRPAYLATIAPDAVELGYSIHEPFRRRGFATEAALAMMHWAYAEHGQRCFFLSISPHNVASTNMACALGFIQCGSHIDDEDGLEIEYLRRFDEWPADWRAKE
jgi:ribosomal-protein-alanine N-acetyltransferase